MNTYMQRRENDIGSCYCQEPEVIYDSSTGFDVCCRCGTVLEMVFDDSEGYHFDDHGADTGFHGMAGASLGTIMDTGSKLSKRIQASLMDRDDSMSSELKSMVATVCRALFIRDESVICSTAYEIAKLHREKVYLSGEKKRASVAMSVYLSCKIHKADREIRAISSACSLDMKMLNTAIKSIKESTKDTVFAAALNTDTKYDAFVVQFTDRLDVYTEDKKKLRRDVNNMLETIASIFDTGKKPRTIIASVIFICSMRLGLDIDKRQMSLSTNVCSQSMDKTMMYIKKTYNIDF